MALLLESPTVKLANECVRACICSKTLHGNTHPKSMQRPWRESFDRVWSTKTALACEACPAAPPLTTTHQPCPLMRTPRCRVATVPSCRHLPLSSTALTVSSSGWQGWAPTHGCATQRHGQEKGAVRGMIKLKNHKLCAAPHPQRPPPIRCLVISTLETDHPGSGVLSESRTDQSPQGSGQEDQETAGCTQGKVFSEAWNTSAGV